MPSLIRRTSVAAVVLASGAVLSLAACSGPQAARPAATAAQPSSAGQEALASLRPWLGTYHHDGHDYLRQGALAARLQALLGPEHYAALLANMQVAGPLSQEGGVWFVTGNRPHQGGSEQAAIAIDPQRDALRVWLRHRGRAQEFTDPQGAVVPWPQDVRTLLQNAGEG
ncbi:hypothetical protein [Melaminivora alkalimesophila]|uniref:Uncharacterized protein n=1 Tax=Melaminivora alkalimesophila TaxID=1165852 RepID=A0A317R806_9BURK|nr:hypothetical protein [Melaminivora alkalimesophila]PWW43555.1 hypothetical protein DFR36_11117 [Melaminivora alkalimesophila]